MKVPMEAESGSHTVRTAFTVAAVVGVMLVLIVPFMAIIAYGP